ncbi:MAG: 4'-phosphopantetheinyl transferase superfamily protein [Cyanobacteria bacterium P01_D01_bin.56]
MEQPLQTPLSAKHEPWLSSTPDVYTTLATNTVDLWLISLDQFPNTEWLSEDELARLHRYRFEKDQRKFAVARSTLRQILGNYTQTNPGDVVFDYSARGKPSLRHNQRGLQFNLSHSGEYALCGVAQEPLGVDIEQLRFMDRLDGLIERCLAPSEQRTLSNLPEADKSTAFLEYWTCKEAYLKATGQGISESLTAIEVELAPTPKLKVSGNPWYLQMLAATKGYTAAVVTTPNITQTRFWYAS